MKRILFAVLPLIAIISCQKGIDGETTKPASYSVSGKVEKGPFVQGSTISMATLDSKMNATGKTYSATISDDAGTFGFGSQEFDSPYARITASGYFYNEVTRSLSNGPLTLSALVDLSDKQSVNVNLLTHLKAMRIQKLISTDGKSFKDANSQAQTEILQCFDYEQYAGKDVSQFSITAGTDEAAALIVVSSQIQVGRSEAQITEFISKLSADFAEDGAFSESNQTALHSGVASLYSKMDDIAQGIIDRYSTVGVYVTVKDLKSYVDWDGDGTPGNEFLKEGEKVTLSQDSIDVPAEGGNYTIKITSPITVFLENPNAGSGPDSPSVIGQEEFYSSLYADGVQDAISVEKALDGENLSLKVGKSKTRKQSSIDVELYAYDGTVVTKLHINQAPADKCDMVGLGANGHLYFAAVAESFAQAMTMAIDGDRFYTLRASHPQLKAPLSPSYSSLYNIWCYYYMFINRLVQVRQADLERRAIYKEFFDIYSAIAYYNMVVFWGGVPYITEPITDVGTYLPRDKESDIIASLTTNLKAAIEYAEDKRNVAVPTLSDEALFLSKDVARIALADIYMYQGKYSDAKPLLEAIVNSGYYGLDAESTPRVDGRECIMAIRSSYGTRSSISGDQYIVLYSYADVLLSLAECEYRISGGTNGINRVNQILAKLALPPATDVMTGIKTGRKGLDLPGYFAFLKRNGIAKSEVGYEDYQLLWPIPANEIMTNPKMTQNPGY